jgi:hypothetical protein
MNINVGVMCAAVTAVVLVICRPLTVVVHDCMQQLNTTHTCTNTAILLHNYVFDVIIRDTHIYTK